MAYITQAELQSRWPTLKFWTDDDASGAVDAAIVTKIIELADAQINRAASQHYDVPLDLTNTETAAIIEDLSATIAGWKLAERVNDHDALDAMTKGYDDALEFLKRLAAGEETLEDETIRTPDTPSGKIVTKGEDAVITSSNMTGW